MSDSISPFPSRPDNRPESRERYSRGTFSTASALLWISGALLLAIIVLPIGAIFIRSWSGDVFMALSSEAVQDALVLSLLTSLVTLVIAATIGTPLAYLLARKRFAGHSLIDTIVDLPIVLPPAVAGVALLMAFGRRGVLGGPLSDWLGIEIPFTVVAVVLAQLFVSAPFHVRAAKAGFEGVDRELEQVAATLGMSRFEVFRRITLPLCMPALLGGAIMTWARALGEFGATIMFAGNFAGRTQTMPLAIFQTLETGELDAALALSVILVIVSFTVLIVFRQLARRTFNGKPPGNA